MTLAPDLPLAAWSALCRRVLRTTWPYSAQHTSSGPDDVDVTPTRLHPAFHGCFDWHSSVHMHWSLVRLATLAPDHEGAADTVALLDERLTPAAVEVEARYLRDHPSWERPYGWGWAAALAAACAGSDHPHAPAWATATAPLLDAVADLVTAWLPRLAYPVRHGVHSNTAFGLLLVHDAASSTGRDDLAGLVARHARAWFGGDVDAPTRIEPSGSDFLSPTLVETALLRRTLPAEEFAPWLTGFLPDLGAADDPLLAVPEVLDPTDGHAVHLHGLGLSRTWVLRELLPLLPADRADRITAASEAMTASALPAVVDGDFMSTHWLVSFALLAHGLG